MLKFFNAECTDFAWRLSDEKIFGDIGSDFNVDSDGEREINPHAWRKYAASTMGGSRIGGRNYAANNWYGRKKIETLIQVEKVIDYQPAKIILSEKF